MKKWIGWAALVLLGFGDILGRWFAPAAALAKRTARTSEYGAEKAPDIEETITLILTAGFVIGCIVVFVIFLRNKLSSDEED